MSDLLKRIADYFANRAKSKLRNIKYNKCKDCAGCVQCKVDEANAIQEYIAKVVEELEEWSFETKILVPNNNELGEYEEEVERKIICTQNAIEIVKQGGVGKEVN